MRTVTATVGAAALATAGVVAYNLPGPAHKTAATANTSGPAQPASQAPAVHRSGDDGGEQAVTTPAGGTVGNAPAHTTSGGS
jgi:hypothetical protein